MGARVQESKSGHLYPCAARNLTREGYRKSKLSSVPENMSEISFSRVQKDKNCHLYPKICQKSAFLGYRRAKVVVCTRAEQENGKKKGTREQKPPPVPFDGVNE